MTALSLSTKYKPFIVEVIQPPTSAVRKFLSLLEQSDIDFSEELGKEWKGRRGGCMMCVVDRQQCSGQCGY